VIGEETARYIMSYLLGIPWPEGDPEICHQAAGYWRDVGIAVGNARQGMERSSRVISESGDTGLSIKAFQDLVKDLSPRLDRLELACGQLAKALDEYARGLADAQHKFSYLATKVAVDIGVTVLFGFLTVGLGSAVTAAYIAAVFGEAYLVWTGLALFASRAAVLATYYAVDSIAYSLLDVAALHQVDAAFGETPGGAGDYWRTFAANVGFDAAFDAQEGVVRGLLGTAVSGNIWTRAIMRFTGSAFVYTPLDNALAGKSDSDLLSTDEQLRQKAAIHLVGRPLVTEPFRGAVGAGTTALVRGILGR
jgi:hypothetical protein